jgi:hypothetical protein
MTAPVLMAAPILDGAAPGANTDILADDVAVRDASKESGPAKMVVQLVLATESVVNLMVRDADDDVAVALNGGDPVPADTLFKEEVWVSHPYTYNLQVETDGAIKHLTLVEVK